MKIRVLSLLLVTGLALPAGAQTGDSEQTPAPARAATTARANAVAQRARAATLSATLTEAAIPAAQAEPAQTAQAAAAPRATTVASPTGHLLSTKGGQMLNVQIEVTLSDSKGTPKTVVLTVADGEMGQNRTGSDLQLMPSGSYKRFEFNADARPSLVGNKIRLQLTAEATVPAFDAKGSAANISLRQSQTLILNDGDSVEIARATDPVSDRAFALSVKVKIQK
jgi:hypothetical protein